MQLTVVTNTEREVSFDTMDVEYIDRSETSEGTMYVIELASGETAKVYEDDQDGNTRALLADLYLYHDSVDQYEEIG